MTTELSKKNGVLGLERNGYALQCPYATRLLIPNIVNSLDGKRVDYGVNSVTCCSACALFTVLPGDTFRGEAKSIVVDLACGSNQSIYYFDREPEEGETLSETNVDELLGRTAK